MDALSERPVERPDGREQRAGLHDRVDAQMRSRAVRGAPGDLELGPDEALVCDDELELGRLGHDGGVRVQRPEHVLDAEARVLLVRTAATTTSPRSPSRPASRQATSAAATPAFMS